MMYRQGKPPTVPVPNIIDLERRGLILSNVIIAGSLDPTTREQLYWLDGLIDGGDIGEPAKAMDYLDVDIDGGTF